MSVQGSDINPTWSYEKTLLATCIADQFCKAMQCGMTHTPNYQTIFEGTVATEKNCSCLSVFVLCFFHFCLMWTSDHILADVCCTEVMHVSYVSGTKKNMSTCISVYLLCFILCGLAFCRKLFHRVSCKLWKQMWVIFTGRSWSCSSDVVIVNFEGLVWNI